MSDDRYQNRYGHRERSNWGAGTLEAPYAEGDVVEIPMDSLARRDGRIPHEWSTRPEVWSTTRFRVVSSFSVGEGDDWYFRVCPIIDGRTVWDEPSDRLHKLEGGVDFTADWTLMDRAISGGHTDE